MLKLSKNLFGIEYNHLVAKLLDGNKALDIAKRSRMGSDYASQCNQYILLFKHLVVSQRQLKGGCYQKWN